MNKSINKIMGMTLATVIGAGGLLGTVTGVSADSKGVDYYEPTKSEGVLDEKWGYPTLVFGGGLTDKQQDETADELGIKGKVIKEESTGKDLVRYLGGGVGDTTTMKSSVLITKKDKIKGVEVTIVTPDNITVITPKQYEKVALNMAETGLDIKVASVEKVSGESALTGVYKALEVNGVEVSEGQMEVANAETSTFAKITEDNKENASYNPDDATVLLSKLQSEVKALKDKQNELLSEDQIKDLINKEVEKQGLEKVITPQATDLLVSTLQVYQNTPEIIDSKLITDNNKEFVKDLSKDLDKGFNYLKDKASNVDMGAVKDDAQGFFSRLWSSVKSFFSSFGS